MPAPQKSQLASKAKSLLRQNNIDGENMPDLADALGDAVAFALTQLLSMAKVAPGIPMSPGASAGPGSLL